MMKKLVVKVTKYDLPKRKKEDPRILRLTFEELTERAEGGSTACMNRLAELYLDGFADAAADPEKAVYWYRRSAETGCPKAMYRLGEHLAKGYGTARDLEQAADWMARAAEGCYRDEPNQADYFRGLTEAMPKAEAGDAEAQSELAVAYWGLADMMKKAGPGTDYEESVRWARLSAEQGNGQAMSMLSLAYQHGNGVEQNEAESLRYLHMSAEAGYRLSQYVLGDLYVRGERLERNIAEGFRWMTSSAELGLPEAMKKLGHYYQEGIGCEADLNTAIVWYEKSLSLQGNIILAIMVHELKEQLAEAERQKEKEAKKRRGRRKPASAERQDVC